MSALRTAAAAAKHTRTLSQPLRRTVYTPHAALQYSRLSTKPTTSIDEAAHEHEREHAARTVHVVAVPNTADLKSYGVPMGAYPNATPYYPVAYAASGVELENANMNVRFVRTYIFLVAHARTVPCITAGIDDASASPSHTLSPLSFYLLGFGGRARDGEDGLGLVMTWLVSETLGLQ
jgi:hypothetical protein